MGLLHPGLGERLEALVEAVRAKEAEAGGNPPAVAALKAVLTYSVLALINLCWRDDGTNGLDWEKSDRTADEEWAKGRTVTALSQVLGLMHQEPIRTWPEVAELEGVLGLLRADEDADWEPEIVEVGGASGITVERQRTIGGMVSFQTPEGAVVANVYKARTPDVWLEGVDVYLVQRFGEAATAFGVTGQASLEAEYAVMVDDPYWGRTIQPGQFGAAPADEAVVMGWRVKGRVLHDGEPVAEANVSLEGLCQIEGLGPARFWDSLEYNELIWSDTLETYCEGSRVYAPIMTDSEGCWECLLPKGYGAMYQREGDGVAVGGPAPVRFLERLWAVYRGRKVELAEDVEAVIDLLSGRLEVHGEPGCWVKVGTLDDSGDLLLLDENGTVTVEGLPSGEHNVVQFRISGWGGWDSQWGCPRQTVVVSEGTTASVSLGMMERPEEGYLAGRVYERPGVPAAGIAIVPVNFETLEAGEPLATTDGSGYFEIQMSDEGLGGDPWIMDAKWGTVPLIGFPYFDIVLGARAYSGWQEMWKPEAWRKGDRGHANFQWVPDAVRVEDESGLVYGTVESECGGWITSEAMPRYKYVGDVAELQVTGPQLARYDLYVNGVAPATGFELRGQTFEEYETLAAQYRAAGYYPENKFLLGGKIKGSVVSGDDEPIGLELAEAHRIGLEFGRHEWFSQVTQTGGELATTWADLVCPYCGGPTWRDPSRGGYRRGFCVQCAMMFGDGGAMDGRTHFVSPALNPSSSPDSLTPSPSPMRPQTVAGRGEPETANGGYGLSTLMLKADGGNEKCDFAYDWRPDLYDETEAYLTQSGAGQATNAPRWFARHVDEVGDGMGFGRFDSAASPPFQSGHDLAYFGNLPEVQRQLGATQMKLAFPYGYSQAAAVTLELDCVRVDGGTETVRVVVPAGTSGAGMGKALSDVVPLVAVDKLAAESKGSPFAGCGFFAGVTGARVIGGGECRFSIVNDTPLLAGTAGVWVEEGKATIVALQTGALPGGSGPHLLDDAVGQVFLFYARDGQIWMKRRKGLVASWETARQLTEAGVNLHPCAEKDDRGRLQLMWQRGGETAGMVSVDDGEAWVEV